MRSSNKHLIAALSISTAALMALPAAQTAHAAFLAGPALSSGPRMSAPSMSPSFRSEPRFQRFNRDDIVDGNGRGKGKGKVSTGDGDRRHPGKHPGRGTVIGTGVAVGTGVIIGTTGPAGAASGPNGPAQGGTAAQRNAINIPPPGEERFVKDEVMLELAANFPPPGIAQLLARHGLAQLEAQTFTLTNSTVVRARIVNRRPVRVALQGLGGETILRSAQPNYLYQGSQEQGIAQPQTMQPHAAQPEPPQVTPAVATAAAIPSMGDPAQYVLAKLHINEAHALANGDKVLVAVIDSGIDAGHPEIAGAIAGSFDALGKAEKPHPHGTAIAGAIVAHARLMGAAPAAKILAIRAFGSAGTSAEATSMAILKSVEYAAVNGARIVNMSFAGPADPGLSRELAGAKAKGLVLIAASGNFGPKSPPQYPAADPNVIAVSATDADDHLFAASNIGPHIALAAPGVDILLPAPGNDYRMISGTSFSAAYVSGVAALVLQRAPNMTPDEVRAVLQKTAKDLGPAGKDPEFGAGLVDAYGAAMAVQPPTASAGPELSEAVPKAQ